MPAEVLELVQPSELSALGRSVQWTPLGMPAFLRSEIREAGVKEKGSEMGKEGEQMQSDASLSWWQLNIKTQVQLLSGKMNNCAEWKWSYILLYHWSCLQCLYYLLKYLKTSINLTFSCHQKRLLKIMLFTPSYIFSESKHVYNISAEIYLF